MKLEKASKSKLPMLENLADDYELTKAKRNEFKKLLEKASSENELHKFLENNPAFFIPLLKNYSNGHHGTWVFSKQQIKHKIQGLSKGLIPDFLVIGKNSDGYTVYIIELKKSNENLFTKNTAEEVYMTTEFNKGLCQLFSYMRHVSDYREEVRKIFQVENILQPEGILIMGRQSEMDDRNKSEMKYSIRNVLSQNIQVNTYDTILNHLDRIIDFLPKQKLQEKKLKELVKAKTSK